MHHFTCVDSPQVKMAVRTRIYLARDAVVKLKLLSDAAPMRGPIAFQWKT